MHGQVPVTVGQLFSRTFSSLFLAPHGLAVFASAYVLMIGGVFLGQGSPLLGLPAMLAGVIGTVVGAVMVIAQVHARLDNRVLSPGEAFRMGNSRGGVFVLVLIVVGVLSSLAAILLIVPGVMLFLRWYVAGAAAVGEKLSVGAAMKRSAELTAGHRWTLLVYMLAVAVVMILAMFPLGFLAVQLGEVAGVMLIQVVMGTFDGLMVATASAVTLHTLREAKEGPRSEAVAGVFA